MEKEIAIKIINELFLKFDLNANKLSVALGMSRAQGIYDVLNPDKLNVGISKALAEKICNAFPSVDKAYLLTGDGQLLKSATHDAKPVVDFDFVNIPFVPIHAQGGYSKGYGDVEYIENLPTIPVQGTDRAFRGKYRVFEVSGDSMDDGSRNALYDGDKILCREVKPELWRNKLHISKWYFVICIKEDGITVKKITDHNVENGDIVCHPLNNMFEDFTLNLSDVCELYNVIRIVDRNARI